MTQACHPQKKAETEARLRHSERWSSVGQEETLLETESEVLESLELVCLATLNFLLWQTEWRGCHCEAPAEAGPTGSLGPAHCDLHNLEPAHTPHRCSGILGREAAVGAESETRALPQGSRHRASWPLILLSDSV